MGSIGQVPSYHYAERLYPRCGRVVRDKGHVQGGRMWLLRRHGYACTRWRSRGDHEHQFCKGERPFWLLFSWVFFFFVFCCFFFWQPLAIPRVHFYILSSCLSFPFFFLWEEVSTKDGFLSSLGYSNYYSMK